MKGHWQWMFMCCRFDASPHMLLPGILIASGLEKSLSGCLGHKIKAVGYPSGQVTFHSHLPDHQKKKWVEVHQPFQKKVNCFSQAGKTFCTELPYMKTFPSGRQTRGAKLSSQQVNLVSWTLMKSLDLPRTSIM